MQISNIKERIFQLIRDDDRNKKPGLLFDTAVILLILINVALIIAGSFEAVSSPWRRAGNLFYGLSCVLFTVEYLLRLWTADLMFTDVTPARARLRYVCSFMSVIDLLAILPFYLPRLIPITLIELRLVRALNLLHLFGSRHYIDALTMVKTVLKRKSRELLCSMLVVLVLLLISALMMYSIESRAQPSAFKNAVDGMWWAVVTLSTIGYGDIVPITMIGRFLSMLMTLLGIMLVAVPGGIITAGFVEGIDERRKVKGKHFCPYCGKDLE